MTAHAERSAAGREAHAPHGSRAVVVAGIVLVALAACVALGLFLHTRHVAAKTRQARERELSRGPRIAVAAVQMSSAERVLTLDGDVRGFQQITLYAKIAGYLREMRVDRGDRVTKGQILGVIESPETDEDVRSARSNAEIKTRTAVRQAALAAEGITSQIDRDNAVNDARMSRAQLQRTASLQDYLRVRAPFDGVVTARYADPGALLPAATTATQSAQPLLDVADVDQLRVFVYVGQDAAPFIHEGDRATLWQDEVPEKRIPAAVTRISRALDPRTRTMQCEIDVDNRAWGLLPGTFVHAEIRLAVPPSPAVSTDALVVRDGVVNVARIDGDRVHFVPVELGLNDGRTVRVNRGVAPGDRVAINVPVEVVEGQAVQTVDAPPPAQAAAASKPMAPEERSVGGPVLGAGIDAGAH